MKAIKNDYDTNVMYDIVKVARKLQIYVSHDPIDLSTVLIPNYGSLEESFAVVHNNGQLVIDATRIPMYVNGGTMNITIPRMKLEEMKQYLFNIISTKIHALYYKVPHDGFSITVKLRNNYDMHIMFDISAARGKLEIYIDHVGVSFIIAKYICPNASLVEMMNHVITDYTNDSEDERREVTQNDYTFDQMVEWAEQEHFENEETKEVQRQKPIWKNRMY
ncbi:hypothetical protein Tco_0228853 [Tanacetum coccineum]